MFLQLRPPYSTRCYIWWEEVGLFVKDQMIGSMNKGRTWALKRRERE